LSKGNFILIAQRRTIELSSKSESCTVLNYLAESSDSEWECACFFAGTENIQTQRKVCALPRSIELPYDHKAEGRTLTITYLKHFLLQLFPVCNYSINCVIAAISIFRTMYLFMQCSFLCSDMPTPKGKTDFCFFFFTPNTAMQALL